MLIFMRLSIFFSQIILMETFYLTVTSSMLLSNHFILIEYLKKNAVIITENEVTLILLWRSFNFEKNKTICSTFFF